MTGDSKRLGPAAPPAPAASPSGPAAPPSVLPEESKKNPAQEQYALAIQLFKEKKYPEARKYYEQALNMAIEIGDKATANLARLSLGNMYYYGFIPATTEAEKEAFFKQAKIYYMQAAAAGMVEASCMLAISHYDRSKESPESRISWDVTCLFVQQALLSISQLSPQEQESPRITFYIGCLYKISNDDQGFRPRCIPPTLDQRHVAEVYLRKAAKAGFYKAEYSLACLIIKESRLHTRANVNNAEAVEFLFRAGLKAGNTADVDSIQIKCIKELKKLQLYRYNNKELQKRMDYCIAILEYDINKLNKLLKANPQMITTELPDTLYQFLDRDVRELKTSLIDTVRTELNRHNIPSALHPMIIDYAKDLDTLPSPEKINEILIKLKDKIRNTLGLGFKDSLFGTAKEPRWGKELLRKAKLPNPETPESVHNELIAFINDIKKIKQLAEQGRAGNPTTEAKALIFTDAGEDNYPAIVEKCNRILESVPELFKREEARPGPK